VAFSIWPIGNPGIVSGAPRPIPAGPGPEIV
jgi:hypothetical protein